MATSACVIVFSEQHDPPHGSKVIAGVTDASGFVGQRLVRTLLDAGYSVRTIQRGIPSGSREALCNFAIDLTAPDMGELNRFVSGLGVLFHCAGEIHRPELMQSALHNPRNPYLMGIFGNFGSMWYTRKRGENPLFLVYR